jgi:hypothetical protein
MTTESANAYSTSTGPQINASHGPALSLLASQWCISSMMPLSSACSTSTAGTGASSAISTPRHSSHVRQECSRSQLMLSDDSVSTHSDMKAIDSGKGQKSQAVVRKPL